MKDPELHPDDAAAMRHGDRHPGPLVILVLNGGYTAAEQILFQAGDGTTSGRPGWHGRTAWKSASSTPSRGSPAAP